MLPDHQASAQGEKLKALLIDGHTASRSMPTPLDGDEPAVSQVEEFLRIEANVLGGFENHSPSLTVAVMTVVVRLEVEGKHRMKLDAGIQANEEPVEVASIRRRVCPSNTTHEDRSAQPRVSRQSRPRGTQPTTKCREADDDPFIQAPVPPRLRHERDSDTSRGLNDLLRHRPRSIPQAQESA
jgi:hypothetical protein